jgi:hypothetical protein
MTHDEFENIRQFDRRCGDNEGVLFPVTIDRRRLIEYVDELQALVREARSYVTQHGERLEEGQWLERTKVIDA